MSDKDNGKDLRLKYVELPAAFRTQANDIDTQAKISQRTCEALAKHLAKSRPKTPEEFERVEFLKDFLLKTGKHNEMVMGFLKYMHGFLSEVLEDAHVLIDGAVLRDKLKDQGDTILLQIEESRTIMKIQRDREKMYQEKIAEYERNKCG